MAKKSKKPTKKNIVPSRKKSRKIKSPKKITSLKPK